MKKTVTTILMLLITINVMSKPKWNLKKTSGTIKIYTRNIPNSNFKEFMGTAIYNVPIEAIGVAMMDVKNQKKWIKDCKKIVTIKDEGEGNGIWHYTINAPWPVSPRDMVLKMSAKFNLKKGILDIRGHALNNGIVPVNPKYVRITKINTYWHLQRISKNKTKITYISSQDPGGNLPAWIVNLKSVEMPFFTLKNLEKLSHRKIYKTIATQKYGYKE